MENFFGYPNLSISLSTSDCWLLAFLFINTIIIIINYKDIKGMFCPEKGKDLTLAFILSVLIEVVLFAMYGFIRYVASYYLVELALIAKTIFIMLLPSTIFLIYKYIDR